MNNLKTFENYINELDPYGEEKWENGKMAICLLMTEYRHGRNPYEAIQFRNVYAITSDDYEELSSVLIGRIPKARRTAEETIFIKLENYLYVKLGEILHPRKTGTSLVGLVDFMKNKGYKFDEKLDENNITVYKTYFYNKEEVDEYIEDAREFADNQN